MKVPLTNATNAAMRGRPRKFNYDEVLLQAMVVFWTKGYEKTSLEDLVEATGVGAQSLYNAIGSKRTIYLQALDKYLSTISRGMLERLDSPDMAIDAICSIFTLPSEILALRLPPGCLLTMATSVMTREDDPDVGELVDRQFALMTKALSQAISYGQKNGQIRASLDPSAGGHMLATLLLGSQSFIRFGASDAEIEDIRLSIRSLLAP